MRNKTLTIALAVVAALLIGLAGVLFTTQAPKLAQKKGIEKTLKTSFEACQARDFDAFMGTINPATAGNIMDALDRTDGVIEILGEVGNELIGIINSGLEGGDALEKVEIQKLNRDAVFEKVLEVFEPDIQELTALRNFKVVDFWEEENGDCHIKTPLYNFSML